MKYEIFFVIFLHFASLTRSLPSANSASNLQERLEPRDLTYDLSFGWFGTNENDGEKLNPSIKIASKISENTKTESVQSLLRALEEEAKNANSEQQKSILSLIQDFKTTLTETPARYAKILLKNVWHTIDLGAFGTSKRTREIMTAEDFLKNLKHLMWKILELLYNFFSQESDSEKIIPKPKYRDSGKVTYKKGDIGRHDNSEEEITSDESDSEKSRMVASSETKKFPHSEEHKKDSSSSRIATDLPDAGDSSSSSEEHDSPSTPRLMQYSAESDKHSTSSSKENYSSLPPMSMQDTTEPDKHSTSSKENDPPSAPSLMPESTLSPRSSDTTDGISTSMTQHQNDNSEAGNLTRKDEPPASTDSTISMNDSQLSDEIRTKKPQTNKPCPPHVKISAPET